MAEERICKDLQNLCDGRQWLGISCLLLILVQELGASDEGSRSHVQKRQMEVTLHAVGKRPARLFTKGCNR